MEIIYKTSKNKSNFEYCSDLFKGKKVLNGFNKLGENVWEQVATNDFDCQNVLFEKEIIADLFICYPLSVVVKDEIKFKSLYELISEIRRVYNQIYYEEFKDFSKKKKENTFTEKFGIWGHSIYDLIIESIKIFEGEDKPLINVSIGS